MPQTQRRKLYDRLRQAQRHVVRSRQRLSVAFTADVEISPEVRAAIDDAFDALAQARLHIGRALLQATLDGGRWPAKAVIIRAEETPLALADGESERKERETALPAQRTVRHGSKMWK